MDRSQLVNYLGDVLSSDSMPDYCPNGLQVEGRSEINVIVSGVTACQALIEAAMDFQADAVLVHHGFFFKGESPCVVGMKQRRLRALLTQEMNLLAYHIPLDVHPVWGNNAQLAQVMGWAVTGQFPVDDWAELGWYGELPEAMSGEALAQHIHGVLGRQPLYVEGNRQPIKTIAWVTGAAQDAIEQAKALGVDAFLTGEMSERTFHFAKEEGIHFYAAGHHATERYGVQALGRHLVEQFGLTHHFIDIDNPI